MRQFGIHSPLPRYERTPRCPRVREQYSAFGFRRALKRSRRWRAKHTGRPFFSVVVCLVRPCSQLCSCLRANIYACISFIFALVPNQQKKGSMSKMAGYARAEIILYSTPTLGCPHKPVEEDTHQPVRWGAIFIYIFMISIKFVVGFGCWANLMVALFQRRWYIPRVRPFFSLPPRLLWLAVFAFTVALGVHRPIVVYVVHRELMHIKLMEMHGEFSGNST